MKDVAHYLSRITSAHSDKPKFMAMLEGCLQPFVDAQAVAESIPQAYDLDEAIGAQLDVVGQWIGRSRYLNIPLLDPWFRFGDARRGWGRGIWKDQFDPGTSLARLNDSQYRKLLYAKRAANSWDGTVDEATRILHILGVPNETHLWLQDNQDMTDAVCVSGLLPSIVVCFIIAQNLVPVKSSGITRKYYFVSVDNSPLFGFGVQNSFVSGWGTGTWGVSAAKLQDLSLI